MKRSRQWFVFGLNNDAFPHPLPELSLGGPKLFVVAADNKRRLPLPFLLLIFVLTHNWVPTTGLTFLVAANERETRGSEIASGLLARLAATKTRGR